MNSQHKNKTDVKVAAAERTDESEIDLLRFANALWRGKWVIAAVAAAFVLAGVHYAFILASPTYTATAVVALDSRNERNVTSVESVVSGLSASYETVNTELEVMTSRTIGARLVERLDLVDELVPSPAAEQSDKPRLNIRALVKSTLLTILGIEEEERDPLTEEERFELAVTRILRTISVEVDDWSYVFDVSAHADSPDRAVLVANTLADLYIEDQLQVKFDATAQATEWLSQRVAELREDLEASEAAAKEFNSSIDLINAETLDALNRQLKDMRDRLQSALAMRESEQAKLDKLTAAIDSGDRGAIVAAAADARLARIAADIERGRAVEATFEAQIEQVLQRQTTALARIQAQVSSLERSVEEISQQVDKQSRDLVTLEQLQREAEADRLIYESFLVRLREISIQQGIQTADARVISRAVKPQQASAPQKGRIVLGAGLLGILFGSSLVLLLELLNRGYRTSQDLEASTGYNVLGQLPTFPIRQRGKLIRYLNTKPTSVAAEAARNLRTSIELSNVDDPPKVIMSTSSIPGEGKTTTAIMLAHHFAALNRKVLLMEGDIRRKMLEQYFETREKRGLVSAISGQATVDEVISSDERIAFDILPGEPTTVNAADLFASRHFADFMKEIRSRYDHIIIDTPPVLVVPDARSIARFADAVVFCVKWNSTSAAQVDHALGAFESYGLKVTGLVLTQVNLRKARSYGYGGRYGGYGGYGYGKYYGKT